MQGLSSRRPSRPSSKVSTPTRRWLRRLLWALALLPPLLLFITVGWVLRSRAAENRIITAAAARLEKGELEGAQESLAALSERRFLSSAGRRQAAELHFRLGEDGKAHALLAGQTFDEGSPEDRRIRELAGAALRAARLLKQADQSKDPAERVRLVRQARDELPEAPHVLERLVQEELVAMTRGEAAAAEGFEQDYATLRRGAPERARRVREKVQQALGEGKS